MPNPFRSSRPHVLFPALILLAVALIFGGASRYDVGTTIFPRLAACWTLVYLVWRQRGSSIKIERLPLLFWAVLIALPLVQLIPLPWSLWTALPGRGLARDVYILLGEKPWMGVSLTPERTVDFALSLIVPFAAYLLGANLDAEGRTTVSRAILLFAVANAVLGLLQATGGPSSGLYLYAVTNDDSAVGLFANANHLGLFLACAIVLVAQWFGDSLSSAGRVKMPALLMALLTLALLLFAIAATNSRAAAVFSVVAIVAGILIVPFDRIGIRRRHVVIGCGVAAIGLAGTVVWLLNGDALSGRFAVDAASEGRLDAFPRIIAATRDFLPFGSGFGSFEPVFRSYEIASHMGFGYWNQAHDDYVQLAMEGGLAAVALLVAFIAWYVVRVLRIGRDDPSLSLRRQQWSATLIILLAMAHSMVDYPLRTSAMATVFAFAASFLAVPFKSRARSARGGGDAGREAFSGL